ncbi:MAG: hypothetical protein AAF573_11310 [Bacteroidota bacterium]
MKLLKFLLVVTLFSVLTACNNDDDTDAVVGTWNVASIEYGGPITSTNGMQTFNGTFTGSASNLNMSIELEEDGDYNSSGSYTLEVTTQIAGQTNITTQNITGFMGNGTWVRTGDIIVTTDSNGNSGSATILSVDDNQMTLEVNETESSVDNGFTTTTTINATYVFAKQ